MSDLENMTLLELRNIAKEQNIKSISKLKKEELITLLKQVQQSAEPAPKKEEENKEEENEIRYDENDEEQ